MEIHLSSMNSEPNNNNTTTVCQKHIKSINPANSLEPNNTLQYSSDHSVELQTNISSNTYRSQDLNFTSNGSCLAPRDLTANVAESEPSVQDCGRERLKKHRSEVSGLVLIPERWGQEEVMKEWIDYSSFNELLAPSGIMSAREALVGEGIKKSQVKKIQYYTL